MFKFLVGLVSITLLFPVTVKSNLQQQFESGVNNDCSLYLQNTNPKYPKDIFCITPFGEVYDVVNTGGRIIKWGDKSGDIGKTKTVSDYRCFGSMGCSQINFSVLWVDNRGNYLKYYCDGEMDQNNRCLGKLTKSTFNLISLDKVRRSGL